MDLPIIFNINFEQKKNEILNTMYDKIGINPNDLTTQDINMLKVGIIASFDDNICFGLIYKIANRAHSDENYYFMRAKSFSDTMYLAAFTTATVGSAAAAVALLESAGLSGGMAAATSPTGIGGVAFGTVAVTELAGAAAMVGVSYVSSYKAQYAQNIFADSFQKLTDTVGWRVSEHIRVKSFARKSADDVNDWWIGRGYTERPYRPGTDVFELKIKPLLEYGKKEALQANVDSGL
jgi:hypothetical protein